MPNIQTDTTPSVAFQASKEFQVGSTGLDPEVGFAMANLAFAQALGQTLINKTSDMQFDINMINKYEGPSDAKLKRKTGTKTDDAGVAHDVYEEIDFSKMKDKKDAFDDKGGVKSDLAKAIDDCHEKNALRNAQMQIRASGLQEADKNNLLQSLQTQLDKVGGEQQVYTTKSTTDQMSTQQMMNTYNMVVTTSTNFLAAYAKVQEAIVSNMR